MFYTQHTQIIGITNPEYASCATSNTREHGKILYPNIRTLLSFPACHIITRMRVVTQLFLHECTRDSSSIRVLIGIVADHTGFYAAPALVSAVIALESMMCSAWSGGVLWIYARIIARGWVQF